MGKILSILNNFANRIEYQFHRDYLISYPSYVGINLSTICNQKCNFCCYDPNKMSLLSLTLEQFKKMKWLKYIKSLSLGAGIGDSLTNREFIDIFKYVVKTYPHLDKHIDLYTNGVGLNYDISKILARHLGLINISVNAGCEKTHVLVSGTGQETFERIMKNIEYMNIMRDGCVPKILTSIVLTKENLGDLPLLVIRSALAGVDEVNACHYVPVGKTEGIYGIKTEAIKTFDLARKVANKLEIKLGLPSFNERSTNMRLDYCPYPWRTAYLTSLEHGEPEACFCCSGICIGLQYDRNDLGNFKKIWNSPTTRYLRKYPHNRMCDFCRKNDRGNPEHDELRNNFVNSYGNCGYNNGGVIHIDLPKWLSKKR